MPDDRRIYAELLRERTAQARAQRAALVEGIEQMRVARSLTFADDEHDPEGSTVSLDQARDVALLRRTELTLAELAAAERRAEAGTYGSCEHCHHDIGAERLLARPEARLCVSCAGRRPGRWRPGGDPSC